MVVSILRNSNLPWGTSVKGWLRLKKERRKRSLTTLPLLNPLISNELIRYGKAGNPL